MPDYEELADEAEHGYDVEQLKNAPSRREVEAHQCHFCGTWVINGINVESDHEGERHWLSDCRPDLVEHEPGPLCTWHGLVDKDDNPTHEPDCYAYESMGDETNGYKRHWATEHIHFFEDGPM